MSRTSVEQARVRRHPRHPQPRHIHRLQRALLRGDLEHALVAAAQRVSDGVAGGAGVVGLLGKVSENDGAETVVAQLSDKFGGVAGSVATLIYLRPGSWPGVSGWSQR